MTNTKIKLYKFDNHTSSATKIATAKGVEGAIIWIVDLRELWVGNSNAAQAKLILKGALDVSINNDSLTINHYNTDGTTITDTLLFADIPSSSNKILTESNILKADDSPATYNTQQVSPTWMTVISENEIEEDDSFDSDIDKLDKKIAGLADEVIYNEQTTQEGFLHICESIGLEDDLSIDFSDDQTGIIQNETTVKDALLNLTNLVSNLSNSSFYDEYQS